jgi:hypothetical protein
MYYPKIKVVFPHIPKTGGSSLEYFIGQVEHPTLYNQKYKNVKRKMSFLNDLYKRYQFEPEDKRWAIHRPVGKYISELGDQYDSYYSFSFIRNPFSQIKSLYTMTSEDRKKRGHDFPEWEDYIFNDKSKMGIEKVKGFVDQKYLLSDKSGKIAVNEIFPFEYYQDCVTLLARKLRFKPDFEVRLWSTKPKYEFTPDMIERVMDLYSSSYELWKEVKKHWEKTKTPYEGRKKSSSSITR